MLLEFSRAFSEKNGIAAARAHLETPQDFDPALWEEIVAMGWTGIGLAEAVGGSGLDIGAAVPVLESMGRSLLGTPLMSTLLAAQLLARADQEASAELLAAIAGGAMASVADLESEDGLAAAATTLDEDGRLRGGKRLVMDAQSAAYLVVTARRDAAPALAVIETTALPTGAVRPRVLIDHTHRAADVDVDGVAPVLVIDGAAVSQALRDYRLLGALLVAAESTGAAARCLDTIVEYLRTRKQFGKPIGSYQALKHPSVEILNALDSSRSFIYHAATILDGAALGRDQEIACRMAKAQATETLKYAGDRAVQFHGGMGFTWDCDAQLFLRRAQWAQQQYGDAQHHRGRLAELLLDA
jgi:alkylation response protein AidB-like acyl-CoA dehydrogenase